MRDPKRIHRILGTLRAAWDCNPDLRLGQLVMIASDMAWGERKDKPDAFVTEDDLMEAGLRALLEQGVL